MKKEKEKIYFVSKLLKDIDNVCLYYFCKYGNDTKFDKFITNSAR